MSNNSQTFGGYVCSPYLHDHDSIELKDRWVSSKNIESLYFVTATFSDDSKPYFLTSSNHYILAKFKNHEKISKEILSQNTDKPSFLFKLDDTIFDRPINEKTNFVSIYYLEYGDSKDDLRDVSAHVARREKVCRAGFGNMKLLSKKSPKFAFPYSDHIVMLEISSDKSHQSDNKYCEQTRRDICRKGIVMNNLVSLSILETMK
ncbi:MAG: hypothetical protein HOM82_01975 [Thaumarchaeota archaeon]|jgi:hypothetical protein|nr:hypothetical protein [Nitrososphaerota archaeon]MBT4176393.1 hypothetical protein [Nitrososphaerota archaeon]MBT4509470.1 hypothetical protein [Nitrososphaerota archaeon]MBT4973002.1 hypothetical protein [Nitrososphaerota archaeon]MBT5238648.1 hypothetical protein [Nitrososphaerota archaeon]